MCDRIIRQREPKEQHLMAAYMVVTTLRAGTDISEVPTVVGEEQAASWDLEISPLKPSAFPGHTG